MRCSTPIFFSFVLAFFVAQCAHSAEPNIEVKDETEERKVPNYDGRESPPLSVSESLLWIPRVALFPAYLASEYLVRQPVRWLGRTLEQNDIPFLVVDFFKFGEESQFLLVPTLLVDFGFRSSVGFYFRWKNFLGPQNRLTVRAAYGGSNYVTLKLTDEIRVGKTGSLRVGGEFFRRPDLIYQATGPLASWGDMARYSLERKEATVAFDNIAVSGADTKLELAAREVRFSNGACCNDLGVDDRVAAGAFANPSRYPGGYSSLVQRAYLNLNRRVSRPVKKIGVGAEAGVEHSFDFKGGGWWVYGGGATFFWDPSSKWRVFTLNADWTDSRSEGGAQIPFNELPSLGGNRPLSGFLAGRLIDRSAFALTLEYKWPVASILDGAIHFGLGNVFGPGLDGLSMGRLRKSIGFGIEASGEKSSAFAFFVAMGSDTLERGGSFNEFRFSLRFGGGA